MRVLIVGLGSIGRRHLSNLRIIQPAAHIVVWHQHTKAKVVAESSVEEVYSLKDALVAKPDVALITNPAPLHIETGLSLAQQNIHLFIEKPLSSTMEGVNELINMCRRRSLTLMVGYNLRFYQPLKMMRQALIDGQIGRPLALRAEVGQYLPDWRPDQDYRESVSAKHALGGGAILELSHELDYVRWLLGEVKTVRARVGRLSDLEIDVEDTVESVLEFKNGAIGSVHLDMVQRPAIRTCRIIGTRGTLMWDGLQHHVQLFSSANNSWTDLHPARKVDRNEMYVAELRHFFDCVRDSKIPLIDGEEGRRVLEIALAIKESSQEQKVVEL